MGDHIVFRFGPGVPPNVLRRACLGCGDVNDFPLPASVEDVIRSGKSFAKRHKACRQPSDSNKSPNHAAGGDRSGVENER